MGMMAVGIEDTRMACMVGIHCYLLVFFSDGAGGCFLDGYMCDGWYQATNGSLGELGPEGERASEMALYQYKPLFSAVTHAIRSSSEIGG
jgi:hypothetical protein